MKFFGDLGIFKKGGGGGVGEKGREEAWRGIMSVMMVYRNCRSCIQARVDMKRFKGLQLVVVLVEEKSERLGT